MVVTIAEVGLGIAAGGLSTLSPCVFPLLPLVVGGVSRSDRLAPVWMGAGMIGAFALGGMLFGAAGASLGVDASMLRSAGAALMLLMAAVLVSERLSVAFTRISAPVAGAGNSLASRIRGNGPLPSLLLGAVLGLVWSPCSGPLLASALTLVASEGGLIRGGIILGGFGLGAALPLVGVAYASSSRVFRVRVWLIGHGESLKKVFGAVVGLMGAAVLTGLDKRVEAALVDAMPAWWVALTARF